MIFILDKKFWHIVLANWSWHELEIMEQWAQSHERWW